MYSYLAKFTLVLLVVTAPCQASVANDNNGKLPNILLIMADDLGYNDLHIYNGNPLAHTPSIDQLAREGVRFTRHYTDAVCEPSRMALLTGLFPARLSGRSGSRGISLDVVTLADSLGDAGYRTHHIGKWHVRASVRDAWPDRQGFGSYFGFINQLLLDGKQVGGRHVYGQSRYQDPWLSENGEPAREYSGHLTDLLVENTIESIRAFADNQPWFINFWPLAPHFPSNPAPEWGSRYPQTREGQYYALVAQLDDGVRRILQALENSGQADNTVVIFLSDNGGLNLGTDNNAPLHGRKSEYNEGGVRTPLIIRWPGRVPANEVVRQPVGITDLFPTLAGIAGAGIPANLDGQDIMPAISGRQLQPRPQFYQRFRSGRFGYTVLSGDGRWRLYVPEVSGNTGLHAKPDKPILYDLQADPGGHRNVYDQHPDIVAQLETKYREWHRSARELALTSTEEIDGIKLTGSDLQRTPGYGGFTFAIAYFKGNSPAALSGPVAGQAQAWSLGIENGGGEARLRFADNALTGKLTPPSACNTLIATAYFKITTLHPAEENNRLTMALYQNGRLIGKRELLGLPESIVDTSPATTVGYSADSGKRFNGRLGTPVILNSYTSAQTPVTVEELHRELCPQA
jgi:arylsulfatase A-like enzyme